MYPSTIERQNVQLVANAFGDATVSALRRAANHDDTGDFVELVLRFWKTVNLKMQFADIALNDVYRAALHRTNPWQYEFLQSFSELESYMSVSSPSRSKQFIGDTAISLHSTCLGLVGMCQYILDTTDASFILLGTLSTDALEHEFGKIRQGAGGAYYVTVRAVQVVYAEQVCLSNLLVTYRGLLAVQRQHICAMLAAP